MDEALGAEAGQQALGHPLLQMQVHGVLGEHAGVLENDRPDRCFATPIGELLVRLPRSAERIEGRGPARVGLRAAIERREGPDPTPCLVRGLGEWLSTQQLQRAGKCVAERRRLEARPDAGCLEEALAALDLRFEIFLAISRGLELLLGEALFLGIEVCLLDLARQSFCVAVTDALFEPAFDVVVDDLREAAELFLDGLGLSDEHLEHAVLHALGQHEVVAADFVGRLELAVDAAVALLDAARDSRAGRSGRGPCNGPGSSGPRERRRWRAGCAEDLSLDRC